jgi:hypothetical protein
MGSTGRIIYDFFIDTKKYSCSCFLHGGIVSLCLFCGTFLALQLFT